MNKPKWKLFSMQADAGVYADFESILGFYRECFSVDASKASVVKRALALLRNHLENMDPRGGNPEMKDELLAILTPSALSKVAIDSLTIPSQ